MVAPVASGTLAGSTSGSSASSHKKPPAASVRASADTPRGRTTRTPLLTVAESDIVAGHEFHNPREKPQSEIGVTGGARFVRRGGATPRSSVSTRRLWRGHNSGIVGEHGHSFRATVGTVAKASPARGRRDDRSPAMRSSRGWRGSAVPYCWVWAAAQASNACGSGRRALLL